MSYIRSGWLSQLIPGDSSKIEYNWSTSSYKAKLHSIMKKHWLETSLPKWEKHIHLASASACIVSSVDRSNEWGLAIQWITVGKCKYCKWKWLQCRHFWNMFWCCQLVNIGALHLCQLLAVGSWITWFISSWDKNNCCYKLAEQI